MRRTLCAGALAAALAMGGCGGGDDNGDGSSGGSDQATRQDADAKSAAREFVTELEACFVDSQSYASCPKGSGDVVAETTDSSYVVKSRSASGNAFAIAKTGESVVRSCTPPGRGGCPSNGMW